MSLSKVEKERRTKNEELLHAIYDAMDEWAEFSNRGMPDIARDATLSMVTDWYDITVVGPDRSGTVFSYVTGWEKKVSA